MRTETAIKLLRNGDCMWEKLKGRYNLTDYQIALLRYLLFTFLSESSKLFFILFLYRRHLALCIATLLFLCCIRRTAGGFHCRLSVCKHRLCFFVSDASAADFFNENSTDFIVHGLHFNKLCACTCFFIKKTSAFCCEKETI